MGAAASTSAARSQVKDLLNDKNGNPKPADASDISDLSRAKDEITKLRKMAREFEAMMNSMEDNTSKAGNKGGQIKRQAVMDMNTGGNNNDPRSAGEYVPKFIRKDNDIRELIMHIVTTNILFSSYAGDEHSAIVDAFESLNVNADTVVIQQGEMGDNFYVIQSGILEIYIRGNQGQQQKVGNSLGPGNAFGELALMYNTPRAATIKTASDCVLWKIDRNTYRSIVVHYKFLRNQQYKEFLRNVMINTKKLSTIMSEQQLEKMTVLLEREVFQAGERIVCQGNTGDNFYIIADGTVTVEREDDGVKKTLTTLRKGAYFGEQALLREDVRQASCIAVDKVTVLTLGREDFMDMLGPLQDIMEGKKVVVEEQKVEALSSSSGFSLTATLADLAISKTLGCGAFGRVKLCKLNSKNQYFALKCQAKYKIVESGLQEHVLNEMRVMRRIEHPYIARLYCALQDNKYIYFVLELLQGGELFTHLRSRGKLSEQTARFYAATVVYSFSTLHAKKIAYRDLKPENLVLDVAGYIKLVDFGLAKQLLSGKTWTLCGTPDYLAPEIILNEGHDLAVDYWALGVLLFEMVVGAPPFYAEDPMEVYEKILSGNPAFPTFFTRNLSDLIKKLLRSQQAKRLGNTRGGTAAVVKHKWFSSFDWAGLENGSTKAPYVPSVNGHDDITNFDTFDEEEIDTVSDWHPDLSA